MKKIDVLIVYEHRTREIENACLIAAELQHRGYRVDIRHVESLKRYFIKTTVVVCPHLYNDIQIIAIAKNFWCNVRFLVDLQYEQVISLEDVDIHDPKEQAVNAQHIAWGEAQAQRYVTHNISKNNIHQTGSIGIDLMKREFDDYFLNKTQLEKKFELDSTKKWVLFISSFSYANKKERDIIIYEKMNKNARILSEISDKSQFLIINWIVKLAESHSDIELIYRPHPAEEMPDSIIDKLSKIKNIKIIGEFSIRQWVRVCDSIYTWYSTSIVDAYYVGKLCRILRPMDIPDNLEVEIMRELNKITTYDAFEKSLIDGNSISNEIPKKIIYYYGEPSCEMAYSHIADLCENMMKGKIVGYDYKYPGGRWNIMNSKSIKRIFIDYFWRVICDISNNIRLTRLFGKMMGSHRSNFLHFEKECYGIRKEIKSRIDRFSNILANNK